MSETKRIQRMFITTDGELIVDQSDASFSMQNNAEQGFGNLGSGYFTLGTGQCSIDLNALIPKKGMEQKLFRLVKSQKLCVVQVLVDGTVWQANGIWNSGDAKSDPKTGMCTGSFKFIGDDPEEIGELG